MHHIGRGILMRASKSVALHVRTRLFLQACCLLALANVVSGECGNCTCVIDAKYLCDKYQDCPGGQDERGCKGLHKGV